MVPLSGVLPFCSCCYVYKIIIFLYLLRSYLLLHFLCFVLLLGFLGQNVCIWKCLESSVPVLTLELQEIILWLLIGKSESYVLSVAYLRQLQASYDSGYADLFCLWSFLYFSGSLQSYICIMYVLREAEWSSIASLVQELQTSASVFLLNRFLRRLWVYHLSFLCNSFFSWKKEDCREQGDKEALQYFDDWRYANTQTGCAEEVQCGVKEDLKNLIFSQKVDGLKVAERDNNWRKLHGCHCSWWWWQLHSGVLGCSFDVFVLVFPLCKIFAWFLALETYLGVDLSEYCQQ